MLRSYRARLEMAMDHVNYLKKGLYAYVLFVMYNYDQYTGAPIIIVLLVIMAFIDSLLSSLLSRAIPYITPNIEQSDLQPPAEVPSDSHPENANMVKASGPTAQSIS